MAGKDKKELKLGEDKSDAKNHPPSREGWIMFLSGEINKVEMKLAIYWNAALIILIALLGAAVAALVAGLQSDASLIEGVFKILAVALFICEIVIMGVYEMRYRSPYQERLKELIKIREPIISGELTDCNEINGKWKDYIRRYYGKLLEKSEMDEKKKKLDEGKERPLLIRRGVLLLMALLIAILILVAPAGKPVKLSPEYLLALIPFIAVVLVLFVFALILEVKLKKNNKDVVNQINDRFGDAFIGFISGLVAAYFMWLLLTFKELTFKEQIFLAVFTFLWIFVLFSIVVIWVFIEIKSSGTK